MRIHPTDLLLRKLAASSMGATDGPVQGHVAECPRCFRRLKQLEFHRSRAFAEYDLALWAGARRLQHLQSVYTKERVEGKALVTELLRHPAERRLILIRNHPRFHTWGVFERLLEDSLRENPRDADVSEELARLALALSEQLDEVRYGTEAIEDLRGRAWAYVGNARRVLSDLRGAQEALDRALVHLRQGTREPWERAVWLDLKGSLLRAQRRFDEALRLMNRALMLFLAVGDQHRAGRTLVNMDSVFHHSGRSEEGIPLLYRALELIDPEQEPRLLLMAKHNLIDDLAECGRFMEAQRLFSQTHALYQRFPEPFVEVRRLWVKGKIVRGLGQPEKAEGLFLAARDGFIKLGSAYDLALVSLELAGLYSVEGRHAELKRLAAEMVPIFASLQIHREAFAAFNLWYQAVQAEAAEAEMAARVATALRRARYDQAASSQEGL
jgi:tetratricopeptide (TPR) repeat protein